jgi:anti-anti-sigma factor
MIVDLTDLTFCDCAGIGALIHQRIRLLEAGSALTIVNPPRMLQRLINDPM